MTGARVRTRSSEHKYWAQIPNLVNHRGLSPAARSLYHVYVEISWKNGTSSYSERELADLAGCSRHTIREARQELVDDGWITIDEPTGGRLGAPLVTILDNWPRNSAYFEGRGDGSPTREESAGPNMDHAVTAPPANGSNLDQPGADLDHSPKNGPKSTAGGSHLDQPGRPVDHSELGLKTGVRQKDREDQDIRDSRAGARDGPEKATDSGFEVSNERVPCANCGKETWVREPWAGLCGSCRRKTPLLAAQQPSGPPVLPDREQVEREHEARLAREREKAAPVPQEASP